MRLWNAGELVTLRNMEFEGLDQGSLSKVCSFLGPCRGTYGLTKAGDSDYNRRLLSQTYEDRTCLK